jgi:uncharacterized protein YjiS (DUF1127 family)
MMPTNQSTQEHGVSPNPPEFSTISVLTAARIERAAFIHATVMRLSARIGRRLIAPFAAMRRRQREYEELMSLDDRVLADIGITRGDIPYLLRNSANQGKAGNDNYAKAA